MKTPSWRRLLVCLALIVTLLPACGRKTPPLIPDSPRPEAVTGMQAVTRDNVAVLSWRIPERNVEGRSMSPADIRQFRVYRAEIGRERKRVRYKPYAEIDMTDPARASVWNGIVTWRDKGLRYGQVYGYRVRAVSMRGGVSNPSEEARVAPEPSLAVPANVVAQGGDGMNRISWDPVTTRTDGSPYDGYVGYAVYRGTEPGRYDTAPLNKEPLRTNAYEDTSVVNGRTYHYVIRSLDDPAPPWRESLNSGEASATPGDMTPPARPAGLVVVPGIGRAFLSWNENKERDLAGYHVYRSTRSDRGFKRLTDAVITRTTFFDEAVKSGAVYYYYVTAVDGTGNEGARSEKKKASIEKLR